MELKLDLKNRLGEFKHFWETVVGSCYAPIALREDFRDHLRMAKKYIGFEYLRFHAIFHDNMGVYHEDEKGQPIYNWSYVDKVYDFLLDIGMKPFVEIGFMPEALASGSKTVFWFKGNVTPPKDYEKWYELVRQFILHLVDKYGIDEIRTWRYEIWNEPNLSLFWAGTQEEYFTLYEYSVKAIKSVDMELMVGGPAIAGGGSVTWVKDFIENCGKKQLPFDFISSHSYEVGADFQHGVAIRKALVNERIKNSVDRVRQIMDDYHTGVDLHYTEWGSCTGYFDIIQDMEFQGPFIMRTIKNVKGKVTTFSYWTHSDVFEEQGINRFPYGNGFGLINMYGILKASFNTFLMLKMMGDIELKTEYESSMATISEDGKKIQVAVWNYIPLKKEEESDSFEYDESQSDSVTLTFANISGKYALKKYQIDKNHSNSYQKWVDIGAPQYPSRDQLKYLKENMYLEQTENSEIQINRDTKLDLEIPACGVVLVVLESIG